MRTAEGASEKQSSLTARLRNGLTYLLTYLLIIMADGVAALCSSCFFQLRKRRLVRSSLTSEAAKTRTRVHQ